MGAYHPGDPASWAAAQLPMVMPMPVQILDSLSAIPAQAWDALLPESQPFLRHAFLSALSLIHI